MAPESNKTKRTINMKMRKIILNDKITLKQTMDIGQKSFGLLKYGSTGKRS